MNILHVLLCRGPFPVFKYGGTERVVWALAQEQIKLGHHVKFLMRPHNVRPENTLPYTKKKSFNEQITDWPDIVHFHCTFEEDIELDKPYVCTEHANAGAARTYARNTIFISEKHAQNHHANSFVYNGLNWDDYGKPNVTNPQNYLHFLGHASSANKNLKGAAYVARKAGLKLAVLGGKRIQIEKKGYINFDFNLSFKGMVGGEEKFNLLRQSSALLFPVLWHEPFGLAITESLFFGTPVIGTPFGSLPEIINDSSVGLLTQNYDEMAEAAMNTSQFSRKHCHELARDKFNAKIMSDNYQPLYEKVLNGEFINPEKPFSNESFQQKLRLNP